VLVGLNGRRANIPSASCTRVSELSTEPEPALRSISFLRRSTRPSRATSRASPFRWLYFCLSRSCPRFSRAPTGLTAFALLDGALSRTMLPSPTPCRDRLKMDG
jgi:hypothetical protein